VQCYRVRHSLLGTTVVQENREAESVLGISGYSLTFIHPINISFNYSDYISLMWSNFMGLEYSMYRNKVFSCVEMIGSF
jgi:hypothetical protein